MGRRKPTSFFVPSGLAGAGILQKLRPCVMLLNTYTPGPGCRETEGRFGGWMVMAGPELFHLNGATQQTSSEFLPHYKLEAATMPPSNSRERIFLGVCPNLKHTRKRNSGKCSSAWPSRHITKHHYKL